MLHLFSCWKWLFCCLELPDCFARSMCLFQGKYRCFTLSWRVSCFSGVFYLFMKGSILFWSVLPFYEVFHFFWSVLPFYELFPSFVERFAFFKCFMFFCSVLLFMNRFIPFWSVLPFYEVFHSLLVFYLLILNPFLEFSPFSFSLLRLLYILNNLLLWKLLILFWNFPDFLKRF